MSVYSYSPFPTFLKFSEKLLAGGPDNSRCLSISVLILSKKESESLIELQGGKRPRIWGLNLSSENCTQTHISEMLYTLYEDEKLSVFSGINIKTRVKLVWVMINRILYKQ